MLHTLACCAGVVMVILDTDEEDFPNIGLVFDMSNGTSKEEYDDEEEVGEMVLAVGLQAADGTGCRRWKGGCVMGVVGTMVVPLDESW